MVTKYDVKGRPYREPPYNDEEMAYLGSILDSVPVSFSSRCSAHAKPEEKLAEPPQAVP